MFKLNTSLIKNLEPLKGFRYVSSKTPEAKSIPDNSKCINKVILLGRCISDAQVKSFNSVPYSTFTMATNEVRKTKDNVLVKRSDFHNVYVYHPFLSQKANNLITKGTRIYLEGKLNYQKTEANFFTKIIAEKIIFISGTKDADYENENIVEISDNDAESLIQDLGHEEEVTNQSQYIK